MRVSLSEAKSTLARVLGRCQSDTELTSFINRAIERLWYKGKWVDTFGRWRVCVNQSCLTWPREIETIEAVAICNVPGEVRNGWFEFLGQGPGVMTTEDDIGAQLLDRGNAVGFDEVTGTGKKIAVYCDGSEDTSLRIILKYRNSSGQKVYSSHSGTIIEGDSLALPAVGQYAYSTQLVYPAGLYGVVKPLTDYPVRLYEFNTTTNAFKPLAYYDPKETVPSYRSSFVPNLSALTGSECENVQLQVMGKRRFIGVNQDTDIMPLPHLDAIRLACQAVDKEEKNLPEEAVKYWSLATAALGDQLQHWNGDGVVQPIRLESPDVRGPAVHNLV